MGAAEYPRDLAVAVSRRLGRRSPTAPPTLAALERVFETLFFASLRTEEAQPITCSVTFIDPANPDPKPPARIVRDRWSCTSLGSRVPFDVRHLRKLAAAIDPSVASVAIFSSGATPYIWGVIDQAPKGYKDVINARSSAGPELPGLFQAEIVGIGAVSASRGYELIGTLRQNRVARAFPRVLESGPVHDALAPFASALLDEVRQRYSCGAAWEEEYNKFRAYKWFQALRRILLQVQAYGHGGALLVAPNGRTEDLHVKYALSYTRIWDALVAGCTANAELCAVDDQIFEVLDSNANSMSVEPVVEYRAIEVTDNEAKRELEGAVALVASLTKVDGLVLVDGKLRVHGFGVEIRTTDDPKSFELAQNALATKAKAGNLQEFGTRHRSMLRYCDAHPDAVGFVISQDGDVRAVRKVGDRLIMWDEIMLHDRIR